MAATLAGTFAAPSYAQSDNLKIDSRLSDARFSVDGTLNNTDQTISLGAASVAGTVNLDKSDLTKSTVVFQMYPATSVWPAIDQFGTPVQANTSDLPGYTLVSFQSERVSVRSDGRLLVTGSLLVTRVDRNADCTPNEAYAGPSYGPSIVQRTARKASFVIDVPVPTTSGSNGNTQIEAWATTVVNQEDFPQLMKAVLDTRWPRLVQDEKCVMPATIGEDYPGASCTGDAVHLPSRPVVSAGISEDYSGARPAPVEFGSSLTILVHMQLTSEGRQLSARAGQ